MYTDDAKLLQRQRLWHYMYKKRGQMLTTCIQIYSGYVVTYVILP